METVRQQIINSLNERPSKAIDLSQELGVSEKEILGHLPHIALSLASRGETLITLPFRCLQCGYTFRHRKRFSRPGRCPVCKSTRVQRPAFSIRKG